MPLTAKQRKHLKGLAHKRQPVVLVGNAGVTPALIREISRALDFHELIKIRLPGVERGRRHELLGLIIDATGVELVQEIGRVAALYRRARKPRIALPADGGKGK
ncbi:MAG: YhbY family RNA-binding protein [Gammaproteobacteria bacterium]|nr:YhbY family RNA-binding protein [Gammaproteobacteria bacterium]